MFEVDEAAVVKRLARLYPFVNMKKESLPRHWSATDRFNSLNISNDLLRIRYKGKGASHKDAAAVRANRPIPKSTIVYYYEIKIINKGIHGYMGVGFSEKSVNLNRLPGWDSISFGYHGDDGNFFSSSGKGVEYGPTFTIDDIVGCGINFATREIFFTKNGINLGVASKNVSISAELYPTVGMQTVGEMIDANFGQKPFMYDIEKEIQSAKTKTIKSIQSIELPPEKALWMNRTVSAWLAHEGYSQALEAFNKTTGLSQPVPCKTEFGGGPKVGGRSSLNVILENSCEHSNTAQSSRRSVVKTVHEAIQEEMDSRRSIIRLVQDGKTNEAVERAFVPTLLSSNKQLWMLLKIQQFVEMLANISKDSSLETMNGKINASQSRDYGCFSSTSPSRPSSSHAHASGSRQSKRSSNLEGNGCTRNAVKRRSKDGSGEALRQSPRRANIHHSRSSTMEPLESQNGGEPMEILEGALGNGNTAANGNCDASSVLAGTPPSSTTIIEEFEDFSEITDGLPLIGNGNSVSSGPENGTYSKEELQPYEKYLPLIAFGANISRFADHFCDSAGSSALRRRMAPECLSARPKQRNLVAKALNSAILEHFNRDSSSQLDEYFRKAKTLRQAALVNSSGSLFADIDALVFGDHDHNNVLAGEEVSDKDDCDQ
uniref:B30.2/SPRY domain-containing protein n=1 Tax=Ditylenchus dipsaci TaxID=166011 RepID=A0A915E4E7_9BILA